MNKNLDLIPRPNTLAELPNAVVKAVENLVLPFIIRAKCNNLALKKGLEQTNRFVALMEHFRAFPGTHRNCYNFCNAILTIPQVELREKYITGVVVAYDFDPNRAIKLMDDCVRSFVSQIESELNPFVLDGRTTRRLGS